jgi:hypothetical protein
MNTRNVFGAGALAFALAVAAFPACVSAEESKSAMAAPKCDLEKMQKLCTDNSNECVKVEKGAFEGGYNVTSKDKAAETKFMTEVVIKNCM